MTNRSAPITAMPMARTKDLRNQCGMSYRVGCAKPIGHARIHALPPHVPRVDGIKQVPCRRALRSRERYRGSADRVLLLSITMCLTKDSPRIECSVKMPDRRGRTVRKTLQRCRSCRSHDPTADQSRRIGASRIGRLLRIPDISLGAFLAERSLRISMCGKSDLVLDLRYRKPALAHQGIRVDIPAAEVAERFVGRHRIANAQDRLVIALCH